MSSNLPNGVSITTGAVLLENSFNPAMNAVATIWDAPALGPYWSEGSNFPS